mgnify:CR=1 FL=1
MTQYDFCDDTFSDLHKDVYGFRPRGIIMENWNMMPDEQKQVRWDELCEELEANENADRIALRNNIASHQNSVQNVIDVGAGDRATAISWMVSEEEFYHSQDVEHYVWNLGILFSDYGRELIEEIKSVVTYKEWEAA